MDVARPIVKIDTTTGKNGGVIEDAYWLSSTRLLIISTEKDGFIGVDGPDAWCGHADVLDTTTASRTRLSGLTDLFHKSDMSPCGAPIDFELSPKGTWLRWQNYVAGGRLSFRPAVAMLDGSHFRNLDMDDHATTFWLDDGHIGAILRQRSPVPDEDWQITDVKVYDVQYPGGDRSYKAASSFIWCLRACRSCDRAAE